ncbi:MAG TPA: PQQ-binding-like beta-propeller repeat protein [Rhizomicrobium sp.]|jgi:hypothetical protein|nr:PQQ-binding-like beta-propeller repeat protein [Rhizomicrobium sp.]
MKPFSVRTLLLSSAVLLSTPSAQAANWTNQGYSPGIDGFNPKETTISASNVANLALTWQSSTTDINGVYAMIEDTGTVFVLSEDSGGSPDVVALDGSTGAERWKVLTGYPFGGVQSTGLAAGDGLVFTACGNAPTNSVEGLCGYSQRTGKSLWFDNFVARGVSDGPNPIERPTFVGGMVYVSESLCDLHLPNCDSFWAMNAKNGAVIWGAPDPDGGAPDPSGGPLSPAVSSASDLAYIPCIYNFNGDSDLFSGLCTFASSTGAAGWQYGQVRNFEDGGLQAGVSVSGSTVFFNQGDPDNNIDVLTALNASTGAASWTFDSVFSYHDLVQPTVAKGAVYWPDGNGTLWSLKEKTGATRWSFNTWPNGCSPVNGPNGTESQPQFVNGVVFITTSCSQSGFDSVDTFALSASDGTILWSGNGGTAYAGGAAPMIVNAELYADCNQVCAYGLPGGSVHRPNAH